jgi:hypothetical protein
MKLNLRKVPTALNRTISFLCSVAMLARRPFMSTVLVLCVRTLWKSSALSVPNQQLTV